VWSGFFTRFQGLRLWEKAIFFQIPVIHMMSVLELHIELDYLKDEATP
jgi:hypothetical protein